MRQAPPLDFSTLDIDQLDAGPDLDALVHHWVTRTLLVQDGSQDRTDGDAVYVAPPAIPSYSSDSAAACSLIESLRRNGIFVQITSAPTGYQIKFFYRPHRCWYQAMAPMMELAICQVTLKAARSAQDVRE